jgi:hypothetical protein
MEPNSVAEHLQVIRTLMERSALYRRALAPIMLTTGAIGSTAAIAGHTLKVASTTGFVVYWMSVSLLALAAAFLLVRRQSLKAAEPFWSPPTRRVTQALLPPLFAGMASGVLAVTCPGWDLVAARELPALWILLYGCALHAAGFFMVRGIKLFGWLFVLGGCSVLAGRCWAQGPLALLGGHAVMGWFFGGLHLAYGSYLYFTEKSKATP